MQIACDLSGAAPEIAGHADVADAFSEPVKQSTVQGFVLKLVVNTTRILVRDKVIARIETSLIFSWIIWFL